MKRAMNMLVAMVVGAAASTAMAGTVRMHARAVVEDATVRLGDIATVTGVGGDAEAMAEIVIVESLPAEGAKVKAEQVLFAVSAARGIKATASLQVAGSAECFVVRKGQEAKLAAGGANQAGATISAGETRLTTTSNRTVAVDTVEAGLEAQKPVSIAAGQPKPAAKSNTLSAQIWNRVCTDLEARPEDVRVDFETISPWLDTPPAANQRWMFRANSKSLGAVQFEAQLLEGTRVVSKTTILAKVTRRQVVVVAKAPIARGELIAAASLKEEEMWLDRKLPTLAVKASEVAGLEATRSIGAGGMVDTRDIKAAEMVGRNEALTVFAVSGNLVVKGTARAMEAGKMRDSVRVRNDATGEVYQVTLIGKRLATVGPAVDAETEQKLKGMQ